MTIVNIQSNKQEEKQEGVMYKEGDYFLVGDELYVLAQVAPNKYNLFCVFNMNRYTDDKILHHISSSLNGDISLREVESICGCSVIPVKSVSITYAV